jgi:hypothetical protein
MRRLIYAWAPNRFRGMSFHSWDTNNFPGWDGWSHLSRQQGDRTDHLAVWELGTEDPSLPKIRSDFVNAWTKRLPHGWDRKNVAYVAVTIARVQDRIREERELIKKSRGAWSDIHIVDAEALAQWIELCPTVETWVAEEFNIGDGRFGNSLERQWARWIGVTKPPIAKQLVLAGRDKAPIEEGLKFVGDKVFSIRTDSPAEAVALLYAVIDDLPKDARDSWLSNALVVSNPEKAHSYSLEPTAEGMRRLTVLVPPATTTTNALARNGHFVVNAFGRKELHAQSVLIKRSLRAAFEKELTDTMKILPSQAALDARACGSSVSVWRIWNLLNTASPGKDIPEWAQDSQAQLVVPAALLRGWDESCDGDKEIIEELTGKKYAAYCSDLQPYVASDDPLLEWVDTVYRLVAPSVAFALLGRQITSNQLDALAAAVKKVYGHLEKEVERDWVVEKAETPGMALTPKYSTWLRDGLAETLLCVAYLKGFLASNALARYGDGQQFVDRLYRDLKILREDPRFFASLRDQLPYLAEAAPTPFVEALESLLQGDSVLVRPLFADRGFFGPTYHSGLLSALETLAWSPDYLGRVALLLAHLAEIDPGGNIANRPINSLRDIFLAWHPGTSASIAQRIEVLRAIHRARPEIAWQLLLTLLPRGSDTTSGTHEPTWRDFGRSQMPRLTNKIVIDIYRNYVAFALELSADQVDRQLDLVDRYAEIGSEHAAQLISLLERSAERDLSESIRLDAWTRIRKVAAHHREFAGAAWALPTKEIESLERLSERFTPRDVIQRNRWLFDNQWPDIGYKAQDIEGKRARLEQLRRAAIQDILKDAGWKGLHQLILDTKYPYLVATYVADVSSNTNQLISAVKGWAKGSSDNEKMAIRSVSAMEATKDRDTWTTELLSLTREDKWPPELIGTVVLDFPADEATFELVSKLGEEIERYYWQHRWSLIRSSGPSAKRRIAENYIRFGRASDVIDSNTEDLNDLGVQLVTRALNASIEELSKGRVPQDGGMFSWHLGNVFKWLRSQNDFSLLEVAKLEYAFLPLLVGPGNEPEEALTLHKILADDPEFFVQVLCDLYRPATAQRDDSGDEQKKARAMTAWRLIESWVNPPGLSASNVIETDKFNAWVDRARKFAAERDRLDVADTQIGKIMFHVPPDPQTNMWPQKPVRDLIERLASKAFEQGFHVECINSRGVTSRAPLDGGRQERDLEALWSERAREVGDQWPRTKALFLRIAEDWKHQAKWHDDRSEQMRMRWS